jgi:hypothetical protein
MKRKNLVTLISIFLVPIIFLWLRSLGFFNMDETLRKKRCIHQSEAMRESFRGEIVNIYEDRKNHNIRTLVIKDSSGESRVSTILAVDGSGLFDKLEVGDNISKELGQLMVIYGNDARKDSIMLKYDCED